MELREYTCEHPTVAGKPCTICAEHFGKAAEFKRAATQRNPNNPGWSPEITSAIHEAYKMGYREGERAALAKSAEATQAVPKPEEV